MSSQAEWYTKLRSWVPEWFFSSVNYNEAQFQALAKVFAEIEVVCENHFIETFICQSHALFLDEHGLERNITRLQNEIDATLCARIANITNTVNCPALKALVDALLAVGESTIVDDFDAARFYNRELFFNRGDILVDPIYNVFSIIVPNQKHAPFSFYDREYFYDREDFIGTNESSLALFQLIVETVNKSKALGTMYRLIERLE